MTARKDMYNGKITIKDDVGQEQKASAPVIVSASRATDIPAFYSDWLIERIKHGYAKWKNPFSGEYSFVSFAKARLLVFWTKNPLPLLEKLAFFSERGLHYYFQYTLNDYENEHWEPHLPSLQERLDTFIRLSEQVGKDKVIWRFDPIIISQSLYPDELLARIEKIGDQIYKHTQRLVFSFIDVDCYRKVKSNLGRLSDNIQDIDTDTMNYLAKGISRMNSKWGLALGTCAEKLDLDKYGIEHNRCIDDRLIIKLFPEDTALMEYLGYTPADQTDIFMQNKAYSYEKLKDKGQRQACGCIISKDIGQYDTCPHGCVYCYANTNEATALEQWKKTQGKNLDTIV